jgi:hypothetical protein
VGSGVTSVAYPCCAVPEQSPPPTTQMREGGPCGHKERHKALSGGHCFVSGSLRALSSWHAGMQYDAQLSPPGRLRRGKVGNRVKTFAHTHTHLLPALVAFARQLTYKLYKCRQFRTMQKSSMQKVQCALASRGKASFQPQPYSSCDLAVDVAGNQKLCSHSHLGFWAVVPNH